MVIRFSKALCLEVRIPTPVYWLGMTKIVWYMVFRIFEELCGRPTATILELSSKPSIALGGNRVSKTKVKPAKLDRNTRLSRFRTQTNYWIMCIPALVWLFFFHIYPMLGNWIAFVNYMPKKGIFGSDFVGLKHFKYLFTLKDVKNVISNTVIIAVWKIVLNLVIPLIFALLLNEVKHVGFKKFVQTVVYLPHFISWVILANILSKIFGYTGLWNTIIGAFGQEPQLWMANSSFYRGFVIISDVWKECGFNAIIYLAALTSINPNLYEAAAIDGANRWQAMKSITLPALKPTVILLATLAMANVFNAGFDQIFNSYNTMVYDVGDIIDTWVYRIGLVNMNYSLGTCIGLFKSVISSTLLVTSYALAYKFADYRIF